MRLSDDEHRSRIYILTMIIRRLFQSSVTPLHCEIYEENNMEVIIRCKGVGNCQGQENTGPESR